MAKRERKYNAPTWKVGDIVYFKWDSGFHYQEREIVAETSRSWLVLAPNSPAYMNDQTHWRWPEYCTKLPKCGYSVDQYGKEDHWQFGTKQSMLLVQWANKHREAISNALRWTTSNMEPYRLLNLAKDLGLDNVVAEYPGEDTDVKAESSQPDRIERTDGDGRTKA